MSEPFWDGEISEPSVVLPGRRAEPSTDPLQRIAGALERIATALEQQERARQN